jgi:DNA-binding transcriptional LysR family regulator
MHKEILPSCFVRPTHGDTGQLAEEVVAGEVDAAIVTLPLKHQELHIEELRRDRLVVCLRQDHPLAKKVALSTTDLQYNLAVLYHPQRHPDAHELLLEQLADAGVKVEDFSHASHPSEMQTLVKDGYGFTLLREGTPLDSELTTRPVTGVNWTVATAMIYHKLRHPKTIPILLTQLRKGLEIDTKATLLSTISDLADAAVVTGKRPSRPVPNGPVQLSLLAVTEAERPRERTG